MPKGRHDERSVRVAATAWLAEHYRTDPAARYVIACTEQVRRVDKRRTCNADGLIAVVYDDSFTMVASMEAQSWQTRTALMEDRAADRATDRVGGWYIRAVAKGLAESIVSILAKASATWLGARIHGIPRFFNSRAMMWVFVPVVVLLVSYSFARAVRNKRRSVVGNAVDQAAESPADERWVAAPADALNWITKREGSSLADRCSSRRVGLLRVGPDGHCTVVVAPRTGDRHRPGDMGELAHYVRGPDLMKALMDHRHSLSDPNDRCEGFDAL